MKNKLMLIALSLLTVSFVQANKPYVDQDLVNMELKKIETKPYLDVESLHKQSARLDAKEKAVQSNYPVGSKKSFVDQFKLWGSNHLRYVQSTDKFTIRGKNISDEQVSQIPLDAQSNAIQKAVEAFPGNKSEVVAGAATGFAKKPNMLLLASKSVKSIPVRGKVGLGMALVGAAGTAVYKKYYNSQEEQSGSDKIESSVNDSVSKDVTDKAPELNMPEAVTPEVTITSDITNTPELIKEPSKIEALTRFQNLKANTWDAELFGYKNGGKVATTAALTVAIGGVSYAAYKAYVYRSVIKAYIASKNPFKKSN